ncbi:MAG: phosphopentomutase [Dethiobacteria bacterium]
MNINRVFLIVLDSVGIGELPDADEYGDRGSNTLKACADSGKLHTPNLASLGLYNIDGVDWAPPVASPRGCFARMAERSKGKDTTIGHWEIAGLYSPKPFPTYPEGFPAEIIDRFTELTGKGVLCNKPYSGTQVLVDYGVEHLRTGKLIVYTSADSVFQIAAHEEPVPVEELYRYCKIARGILQGEHGVARVIARPFTGQYPHFIRTGNRHDFSLPPPEETMCDLLQGAGYDTIGVGKIYDIFAGRGISRNIRTAGNADGMEKIIELAKERFHGLLFVNLVDFDMLYGHRNDVAGYTAALNAFDFQLGELMPVLKNDDIVILTADHGCDPSTPSTDHSREYVPMIAFGRPLRQGCNLKTRSSFADIAATILEIFELPERLDGESFLDEIVP